MNALASTATVYTGWRALLASLDRRWSVDHSELEMQDAESAAPVAVGDVLGGKYRVDRVLGIGGMGVVVAAHHLQLDEKVAIKFLLPEALGNRDAVARFSREARAAVRIKNEHVARITDVGVLDTGAPYMVMEYLEGCDLSDMLEQRGPLPIEQAVEFLVQACEAIAEAHGLGIVHRDLKPANLFVIRKADGLLSVKVLDFGISKMTNVGGSPAQSGAMTATRAIMGSPLYMSPEQLASAKDVDARTDIWALGVVLFELLAGTVPFNGETMPELVLKIVNSPTPRVRDTRAEVPEGLNRIVARCLEKDRARRYGNVAELATALAEFGSKRTRHSADSVRRIVGVAGGKLAETALPPSSDPSARSSPSTLASWGQTGRGQIGGAPKALVLVGLGAVVLIGAALFGTAVLSGSANSTWSASPPSGPASNVAPATPPSLPQVSSAVNPPARIEVQGADVAPRPSAAVKATADPPEKRTSADILPKRTKMTQKSRGEAPGPVPRSAPAQGAGSENVFDERE